MDIYKTLSNVKDLKFKHLVLLVTAVLGGSYGGTVLMNEPMTGEELEVRALQPIVEPPGLDESNLRRFYDITALCDCTTIKELTGDGLPSYTYEDAAFKVVRRYVSLRSPLDMEDHSRLDDYNFCGKVNKVVDIIRIDRIKRTSPLVDGVGFSE